MRSITEEEINRVRLSNAKIRNENHLLRCTLRNLTSDPYNECSKVLTSVIDHCTKKLSEAPSGAPDLPCEPEFQCPCDCKHDPCASCQRSILKQRSHTRSCSPPCVCCCFSPPCPSRLGPSPKCSLAHPKVCCKPCCTSFLPHKQSFQTCNKATACSPPGGFSNHLCNLCCDPKPAYSTSSRSPFLESPCRSTSPSLTCTCGNGPNCYCVMCSPFALPRKNICSNHPASDGRSFNHWQQN